MAIKIQNSTIIDDSRNIVNAGVTTVTSVSIGNTQVISSERQLQNIVSLDVTTTSTIESVIANAPNTFTDLNVSGVTTVGFITATNLYVAGVGTFASAGFKIRSSDNINGGEITFATGAQTGTGRTITVPVLAANNTLNLSGTNNQWSNDNTFTGNFTYSGINFNIQTDTPNPQSTISIGGIGQTGTITLGRTTKSQIIDIQAGASGVGTTKTINFGTGGLSGSFTNINIGPTAGIGTVLINSGTNLGIGTTNPTSKLYVVGDGYFTGILTANRIVSSVYGEFTGGGISGTNIVGTALSISGISTFSSGPVLIGSATSTGTASQRLQVTGGAYISDNVGIGTTNPTASLTVAGNTANILIGKQYANANAITLNGSTATTDYNILSNSSNNLVINRPSGKTISFIQADATIHATFDSSNNLILNSGNFAVGNFTPSYAVDAGAASLNKSFRIGSIIGGTAGTSYGIIGYNAKPSALNAWTYDVTDVASWIQFLSGSHVFYRGVSGTAGNAITPLESGRFDSSGNLLIGSSSTTGTASQRLQVTGGAYISDNVGIGTTNPFDGAAGNYGIDVHISSATIFARNKDTTGESSVWSVDKDWFSTPSYKGVGIRNFGTSTAGNVLGSIPYTSGGALSFQNTNYGLIYTNGGSPLIFATLSTEALRIDPSQRVGIKTTNPSFDVDISGDARIRSTNKMRFGGTAGTTNFYIQYNSTANSLDFVAG